MSFTFAVVVRELFYNQPVRRKQIQSRYVIIIATIHTLRIHSFVQQII
jgi:DNA mismatch repair ATPase MutL